GDEGGRGRLVLGQDRVQPRRVDDVDALEGLERVEHLDVRDAARLVAVDGAERLGGLVPGQVAHAVVAVDDARPLLAAILQDVDGRRPRRDADRGDGRAEEG